MNQISVPPWAVKDPELRSELPCGYSDEIFPYLKAKCPELWQKLFPSLYMRVRRITNSMAAWLPRAEKDRIEEETIEILLNKLDTIESGASFRGYLYKVAKLRTLDAIRRANRANYFHFDEVDFDQPTADEFRTYDNITDKQTPASVVQRAEEAMLLDEALERVGLPCKEILTGALLEGKKHWEIAQEIGKSPSSIGNRLNQCLERVREAYEGLLNEAHEANV